MADCSLFQFISAKMYYSSVGSDNAEKSSLNNENISLYNAVQFNSTTNDIKNDHTVESC